MKAQNVLVATLVEDYSLYPRHHINEGHVRDMARARSAGHELPPILVDRKTRKIVDGFHRVAEAKRRDGAQAEIAVLWADLPDDAAMMIEAARLNSVHGEKLTPWDRVRVIVRCQELGVTVEQTAEALHISAERVEELRVHCTARDQNNEPMALKTPVFHMAGKKLTEKQVEAMMHVGGNQYKFYANQLIAGAEAGLLDLSDVTLIARLRTLIEILGRVLPAEDLAATG